MGHQLRACAHCFFRGSEYSSQHPAGQLTVAGGSRALDCFWGHLHGCKHVCGSGECEARAHKLAHRKRLWAPFSVPQKTLFSFCWFLKCETLPLPPCREIYNTPVFLYSKNRKDLCEYVTVCSMIMGPGLLMQKWRHLNQSMTYLSGIHHRKRGAQTVALSGELRAL